MTRTPPLGAEPPEGPSSRDPAREPVVTRNPWWLPRLLGRPPAVATEHVHLLGVISLALLFENYDQAMLTAALKQIAETFGLIESDLSQLLGLVHGGAILAFLIIPFADRIGRRRLFLISLIGLSVATVLAGFAQSVGQFIFLQMVSRAFMITCTATAFVIITEEFPASDRGWGIGIAGALGSVGHGLGVGGSLVPCHCCVVDGRHAGGGGRSGGVGGPGIAARRGWGLSHASGESDWGRGRIGWT